MVKSNQLELDLKAAIGTLAISSKFFEMFKPGYDPYLIIER